MKSPGHFHAHTANHRTHLSQNMLIQRGITTIMAKNRAATEQPRNRNALIKSGNNPGSWTFKNHPESLLTLETANDERLAALAGNGYVPAAIEISAGKRRKTAKDFWAKAAYLADYQESGQEIHKMPDDWTKAKLAGDSSSGFRRTTLRTYKGAGVDLRMPSASAVKEFSKAIGDQVLDIPIELTDKEGKTIQGWVRAVKNGAGNWQTHLLSQDVGPKEAAIAAEAVAAVLEARRPTVALEEVGDLLHRRREKMAQKGASTLGGSKDSGTFKNFAYDRNTQVLSLSFAGKLLGRHVPEQVAVQFIRSDKPAQMWNQMIRGAKNVYINECEKCSRRYAAGAKHACPVNFAKESKGKISEPRRQALRNFRESGVVKTLAGLGGSRK